MSSRFSGLSSMTKMRAGTIFGLSDSEVENLILWQRERERTSLAVFTLEADLAAQEFSQFLAELQAEPRPPLMPRVTLYLAEGLKELGLIFRPNPNARIVNTELCPALTLMLVPVQDNSDFAPLRELDRVVREVEQDLA